MRELNASEIEMVNGAGILGAIAGAIIGGTVGGAAGGPTGAILGAVVGAAGGHLSEEMIKSAGHKTSRG